METRNTILSQKDLELLEAIVLQYGKIVSSEQIQEAIGQNVSRGAARMRVAGMSKAGWLIRLKNGLYLVVTDISTLGFTDVSELLIAQSLNPDSYISFEGALQYHAMFDQMLARIDAVTTRTTKTYQVLKTTYTFSSIKKDLYFGFTQESVNNQKVNVAEIEKAILDLLYFRSSGYTISLVIEKLREYQDQFDFKKLKEYSIRYSLGMVRKIGFLLDQIDVDTTDLFSQNQVKKNSFSKLTQDAEQFNAKWTLTLLDKQALQLLNRKTLRYSLVAAEKDYFLSIVLKILSESPLFPMLVFKGGTAIHHCYIPQSRFSEDLDFTSLNKAIKSEDITSIFTQYPFFEVKKLYTSKATIKVKRLKYSGVLDQPNSLKFEVDIFQNVVLPARRLPYKNVWGLAVEVNVMDIREIYAEKLRAMSERARYRDFYDFYLIAQEYHPSLDETIHLLKQKEVRRPISSESIMSNWKLASKDRHDEMDLVYYKEDVFNHEEWIEESLRNLRFEMILSHSIG
jgi:predicted transcriptional regulator of viral defense system/predicted nucleotidyltransferase component of viral defense system